MPEKPSAEMTDLFFAAFAMTTGAINQGVINREKLIDHLVDLHGNMTDRQKNSTYAFYLQTAIELLDRSQFDSPEPGSR